MTKYGYREPVEGARHFIVVDPSGRVIDVVSRRRYAILITAWHNFWKAK